jgi:hypothetical protein
MSLSSRVGLIAALVLAPLLALPAGAVALVSLKPSARVQAYPADETGPKPANPNRHAFPRAVPDKGKLKEHKDRAGGKGPSAPAPAPSAPAPGAVPGSSVFAGVNQPGLGAINNGGTPPDTTGAIGPAHYLEFVNSRVAVYNRAGLTLVTQRNLDAFVGKTGDDVFDPQIQWDQAGNRWLYVTDDIDPLGRNFLAIGWSKTADPSDLVNGWCRFTVSTDIGGLNTLDDYPKLGHDNNHIIVGANAFRGNTFLTAHIWSISKPAVGDASCAAPSTAVFGSRTSPLTTSDGTLAFTPVPANTADTSAVGYVVASDSPLVLAGPSQIMAWHVSGPANSPVLTQDGNMNVTAYDIPANVPQPGTTNVLDSSDARLTQAVAHLDPDAGAEAVWTQHTIAGAGGRSVLRWYELLPATLNVRQQGTVQNSQHFVFNGAISPASDGTSAVTNYNVGSASLLAQIRAQSRQSGMTLGQMGSELTLGTSSAADQDFSCTSPNGPPCRWGDYAGASPDPLNDHVVWGSNQVNGPFTIDPHWATRNFAIEEGGNSNFARPRGATPIRVPLVVAYNRCTTGNRSHGAPFSVPSCAPPAQSSSFLTVGTQDANGAAANAVGSIRLDAIPGDSATPADEADVRLQASATDVRRTSDLSDYTGELLAATTLRLTDHYNGPSQTEGATANDIAYSFTVPCLATADSGIGGACSVDTTADALTPGTVLETKRSIWQLAQIQLYDGGSDGVAGTTPNTLFEVEGLFAP